MLGLLEAAMVAALAAASSAAQEREDARIVAERIVEQGGYQRELPAGADRRDLGSAEDDSSRAAGGSSSTSRGSTPTSQRRHAPAERSGHDRVAPADFSAERSASEGGGIARPLAIATAIVFGALALWILLARRTAARTETPAPASVRPVALAPESPREPSADVVGALASEGRYGEAVHLLLVVTLARLVDARALSIRPGTTSRELVARTSDSSRRDPLAELVALAEAAAFADRELGAQDFERALDAARRLEAPRAITQERAA